MKKRLLIISGILVVVLAAGFMTYRALASKQATSTTSTQTATVTRGSLTSTLSSSGTARSGQSATISWQTSGKVGEVTLKQGDTVTADQELAALDTTTLSTAMINAKQTLITAKKNLEDLLTSKTGQAEALQAVEDAQKALDSLKQSGATDASQAQLALATAQSALKTAQTKRDALNYPHSTDPLVIEKAQTEYLLAKNDYKDALKAYNEVDQKKLTSPDRVQALNRLVTAEAKMKTTFATYNWYLLDPTQAEIAQADAALAVAQAILDKAQSDYDALKTGTSSAAQALAEAKLADAQRAYDRVKNGPNADDVSAAQAAVDAAQASLDQAHLLAPFAGTLTEVSVKTGDIVSNGTNAFRIDDLGSIYVDLQISEVDIQNLKLGQKASLTFDAISGKTYSGEVTSIGMVGTVSQGVVNYPATVRITDADQNVRPGMTAAVTININQHDNVLIVPNQAVKNSGGQRSVTVLFEGQEISVPVTVGLTNDTKSEVSSPQLKEGDEVVISGSTSKTSTTSSNSRTTGGQGIPGGPGGLFP
ncbi:MAG TPA: efflux RND transporter periplasmic adaptor subunit [Anaerolineales bacterium]